jgi:hypothetical protein
MTFSERLWNTIGVMIANNLRDWATLDELDKVIAHHFPDDSKYAAFR